MTSSKKMPVRFWNVIDTLGFESQRSVSASRCTYSLASPEPKPRADAGAALAPPACSTGIVLETPKRAVPVKYATISATALNQCFVSRTLNHFECIRSTHSNNIKNEMKAMLHKYVDASAPAADLLGRNNCENESFQRQWGKRFLCVVRV